MVNKFRHRYDIQALRTLGLVFVVINHYFESSLSGGYIGVDVFFVISGFLITSMLLNNPPKKLADLGKFWSRRIRRLFPAAFISLALAFVLTLNYSPASSKVSNFKQILASSLYFQNWQLISDGQDYFLQDNSTSFVQHFWSLSVEEQFYILWPILFLVCFFLCIKTVLKQRAFLGGILTIFLISLSYSIYYTPLHHDQAYFSTFTRIWELATGGLLAYYFVIYLPSIAKSGNYQKKLTVRFAKNVALRSALAVFGYIGVIYCAFTFDKSTPVPGLITLIPISLTALVIFCYTDTLEESVKGNEFKPGRGEYSAPIRRLTSHFALGRILNRIIRLKPLQYLASISYEAYLLHFIFYMAVFYVKDGEISLHDKISAILLVFICSSILKHLISDPVRFRLHILNGGGLHILRTYILGGFTTLTVVALCITSTQSILNHQQSFVPQQPQAESASTKSDNCFGAAAAVNDKCDFIGNALVIDPLTASADRSDIYKDKCANSPPFSTRIVCKYGEQNTPKKRIALVGNSHAVHWQPAFAMFLDNAKWELTTYVASVCYTTLGVTERLETSENTNGCRGFNEWAISEIQRQNYDLVVVSDLIGYKTVVDANGKEVEDGLEDGFTKMFEKFAQSGEKILVIKDTPPFTQNVPDCVEKNWDPQNKEKLTVCRGKKRSADDFGDAPYRAAENFSQKQDVGALMHTVDFDKYMCHEVANKKTICEPVVGGVIARYDLGHITKTFSQTLSEPLFEVVDKILNHKETS
ncbi:MAG: acyltransferase [Candidatus Ancillula sp.]|nr:acyltransferase [Candidatus Ancillula sp.]